MAEADSRFNPTLKDCAQVIGWLVASVAALYGVVAGINESQAHLKQQKDDLRWQQTALSRQILERLWDNPRAKAAMILLDYEGRVFEVARGRREGISTKNMLAALRTNNLKFNDKEIFVRDCFDELFYGYELMEHYIRIDLIRFDDVQSPTAYYINRLNEHREPFEKYLNEYEFGLAKAFVNRFPAQPPKP